MYFHGTYTHEVRLMVQLDLVHMGAKPPTGRKDGTKNGALPSEGLRPCFHRIVFDVNVPYMKEPTNRRLIWWLCAKALNCKTCYKRLIPKYSLEDFKNGPKNRKSTP